MTLGRFAFIFLLVPLVAGWALGLSGFVVALIAGIGYVLYGWQKIREKKAAHKRMLESVLNNPPPVPKARTYTPTNSASRALADSALNFGAGTPPPLPDPEPSVYRIEREIKVPRQAPNYETVSATRPPKPVKLQWVTPSQNIKIQSYEIPGMVYVSEKPLGYEGEPSAICRSLSIYSNPRGAEELPYYPSYETLSSSQRGFYLDWLARGRRDDSPDGLPTGYLFLFFYGIERRILIDGDRDPAIWFEIFELLRLYGLKRKSRSVASYFGDFLHYTSYAANSQGYANVCQTLLDLQGKRISETALSLALANHYRRNETMGWSLAHLVAMSLEESRRSVIIERTADAFKRMFQKRFETAYPSGMPLKASKREHTVRYQTGNATLFPRFSNYGGSIRNAVQIKVPGVISLKSQFKGLAAIWNQCIEDLSGYSRAMAKLSTATAVTNHDLLKAHLSLPTELRREQVNPLESVFQQTLDSFPEDGGIHFIPVAGLASLLDIGERVALTQKQSEDIANLVGSLGYTLAPHPVILNLPLNWTQEIAVARCTAEENITPELGGMLRLLFLAVLIASADGVIDQAELAVFHRSSGITDEFGKIQLLATEAALVRDTQVASKQLPKIARSVPTGERMAVFKLLVHTACSDEVLSSDENRLLRKIAKAFELADSSLDDVLTEDSTFHTVTVAKPGTKAAGEAIPKPPGTVAAVPAFSLDMDRIAALTAETAEVVSILSKALAEEAHDEPEILPVIEVVTSHAVGLPPWAEDLEDRYQPALGVLLSVPVGTPIPLKDIAARHHLMVDDLVDGINTWSDEALGDFLIQANDDGSFSIQRDLIPSP